MKFNLLSFWQLHIRKIVFTLGIIMTIFFIFIYFKVPKGDYFDFIIYALAILYSLIFFILSTIQTQIETYIDANYNRIKKKYKSGLEVQTTYHGVVASATTFRNRNDGNMLNSLAGSNLYHCYFDEDGPKFKVESDLISFNKYYLKYENYLSSREWIPHSFLTKVNTKFYMILQDFFKWRFRFDLYSVSRCYGDKLHADLLNEDSETSFQKDVLFYFENIVDQLKVINDFVDYLERNEVVTSIAEIQNHLSEVKNQLDNIENYI